MKIAYFDCSSGISGDMTVGALLDAGLNIETLEKELNKLGLSGYQLEVNKVVKKGISATQFKVKIKEEGVERRFKDILDILEKSKLDEEVKKETEKIFFNIAQAESKIHRKDIDKIHFHEIGGLDSIIDITSAVIGIKTLGIEEIHSSALPVGKGFVKCAHGVIPVPAPATLEILKDENLKDGYLSDEAVLIESNIDDMNPEFYDHIMEKLFSQGALDVFLTPIQMKKNRPAHMLSIIVYEQNLKEILEVLFSESTTLGVRIREVKRLRLVQQNFIIATKYGKIKVKVGMFKGKIKNIAPEYEDCKKMAQQYKVPLKEVYDEAMKVIRLTE